MSGELAVVAVCVGAAAVFALARIIRFARKRRRSCCCGCGCGSSASCRRRSENY